MNTVKLGDVCGIVNGGTPKTGTKEYWDGGILWITPKDLGKISQRTTETTIRTISEKGLNHSSARLVPDNSVILSTRAPIGYLVINTKPMSFNQGCKGLVPGKDINVEFLYHYLTYSKEALNDLGTGTTFPELSKSALSQFTVPLPSLDKQKMTVERLDAAFEKIDAAIELTKKNVANSSTFFKRELNNKFNQPKNITRNILELCELKSGNTIDKSLERKQGDVLYVKVGDMNFPGNEKYIYGSSRYAKSSEIKTSQIIPQGAVIFPKRGGAIATNKKRIIVKPTIVDLNTMALVPKNTFNAKLLYFWFLQYDLSTISSGTSIPQINNYSFNDTNIAISDNLMDQARLASYLQELHEKTKDLENIYRLKLQNLNLLKKSMLEQAFAMDGVE